VAAVTAWTLMEEKLGNYQEAKVIFERALRQFGSQSEEKSALWRAYELMEMQAGNIKAAQEVYRRSLRDLMKDKDKLSIDPKTGSIEAPTTQSPEDDILKPTEVEFSSWKRKRDLSFRENAEVWVNEKDGSIEGKVPMSTMKKKRNNSQKPS
jgi:tetratricopeptide (TPR) repeat protein